MAAKVNNSDTSKAEAAPQSITAISRLGVKARPGFSSGKIVDFVPPQVSGDMTKQTDPHPGAGFEGQVETLIAKFGFERLAEYVAEHAPQSNSTREQSILICARHGSVKDADPTHPGLILKSVIERMNISVAESAKIIGISRPQLYRILNAGSGLTSEMALKIEKSFGQSAEYWMDIQTKYDIFHLRHNVSRPVFRLSGSPNIKPDNR